MLHGILRTVRVGILHVTEPAPERLEPIHREFHFADFTVSAENFHYMFAVDVAREPSNVDSDRARSDGTFATLAL